MINSILNSFTTRLTSLFFGFTLPYRALRLILRKPVLLAWSMAPLVLTLFLSAWGVAWLKAKMTTYGVHWLAGMGFAPESLTIQAAVVFLKIAVFVLAAVSFSFLATTLASPFNDFLSEATEPHCGLPRLPAEASTFRWKRRAITIDIVKTILITATQLILILIGVLGFWIPVFNLLPLICAFWLLAFQFLSYPQTRRGEEFKVSLQFLSRHAFASLGFGAAFGILFAIPIISAFTVPLAVVGGTLLYARAQERVHPLK